MNGGRLSALQLLRRVARESASCEHWFLVVVNTMVEIVAAEGNRIGLEFAAQHNVALALTLTLTQAETRWNREGCTGKNDNSNKAP